MDKVKKTARAARDRVSNLSSPATSSSSPAGGSLSPHHASLPPTDNASTTGVNEGLPGPQLGTAVRDYALPAQPPQQPPTSLQSSVDAEKPLPDIPAASNSGNGQTGGQSGRARAISDPVRRGFRPSPGMRQSSIGVYRQGPAQGLRQVAINNRTNPELSQNALRLPALDEDAAVHHTSTNVSTGAPSPPGSSTAEGRSSKWKRASDYLQSRLGLRKTDNAASNQPPVIMKPSDFPREYDSNMVDVLDTVGMCTPLSKQVGIVLIYIDPEVQTLTSLTNVQNSLFIPNLGRWVNRRPTYTIRPSPSEAASIEDINRILEPAREEQEERPGAALQRTDTQATVCTIDSTLTESRYAVLPHGTSLDGWTKEDKKELNDHVRHMLHSRRSKFKRSMRGFGQYVRRRKLTFRDIEGCTR